MAILLEKKGGKKRKKRGEVTAISSPCLDGRKGRALDSSRKEEINNTRGERKGKGASSSISFVAGCKFIDRNKEKKGKEGKGQ